MTSKSAVTDRAFEWLVGRFLRHRGIRCTHGNFDICCVSLNYKQVQNGDHKRQIAQGIAILF